MAIKDNICVQTSSKNGSDCDLQTQNKTVVESLYKSLAAGDYTTAENLVAHDLEWWFHGPPRCQHMMTVLTGEADWADFVFEPRTITAIDDGRVIVEGWTEGPAVQGAYWVHVWTVSKEGLIVQFREYFNTWLTVRDLRPSSPTKWEVDVVGHAGAATLWQSQPSPNAPGRRAMPGLVLAI